MFKCSKEYRFEYAHQLFDSYTQLCHETIHGHSGRVRITFRNNTNYTLDKNNMVVDFGLVSDLVKEALMNKYDHALFMPMMFPKEYLDMLSKYNKRLTITSDNPTAEMFAKDIYTLVSAILNSDPKNMVQVIKVEFWETESGCAIYQPNTH